MATQQQQPKLLLPTIPEETRVTEWHRRQWAQWSLDVLECTRVLEALKSAPSKEVASESLWRDPSETLAKRLAVLKRETYHVAFTERLRGREQPKAHRQSMKRAAGMLGDLLRNVLDAALCFVAAVWEDCQCQPAFAKRWCCLFEHELLPTMLAERLALPPKLGQTFLEEKQQVEGTWWAYRATYTRMARENPFTRKVPDVASLGEHALVQRLADLFRDQGERWDHTHGLPDTQTRLYFQALAEQLVDNDAQKVYTVYV